MKSLPEHKYKKKKGVEMSSHCHVKIFSKEYQHDKEIKKFKHQVDLEKVRKDPNFAGMSTINQFTVEDKPKKRDNYHQFLAKNLQNINKFQRKKICIEKSPKKSRNCDIFNFTDETRNSTIKSSTKKTY